MTAPSIGIVLPTRNGERYLEEAIGSCVAQTVHEWELVLVDDGSSDRTGEIAVSWQARDARIRVVRHEKGRGLPAALNSGFAATSAPLLTWTSDDNLYRENALERLSSALEAAPEVNLVYADCSVIDEKGRVIGRRIVQRPEDLPRGNGVGACFLYRREVHEALSGYDEGTFRAEDYDFWIRAWLAGFRMMPLHEDLYLYRVHPASLSAAAAVVSGPSAAERVLLKHLPRMPRRSRALALLQLGDHALRRRDGKAARRFFGAAFALSPVDALRRIARHAGTRAGVARA